MQNNVSMHESEGEQNLLEYIRCDLCGGEDQTLLLVRYRNDKILGVARSWRIVKCRNCGLIFVNPRLTPDLAAKRYETIYFSHYEDNPMGRYRGCAGGFKIVKKYFPPGFKGKILDIGCGLGYFVEYLKNNGWDAQGIEVSKYATNLARNKNLNIVSGDFLKAEYPSNYFDCITMWDVIEHVPYPMRYIREAYKILKPGGLLSIQAPNIENLTFLLNKKIYPWQPSEHLFYFSAKTLKVLLDKNNFELIDLSISGNMKWVLTRLFEKEELQDIHRQEQKSMERNRESKVAQYIYTLIIRLVNKVSSLINRGEVLLVAARKIV